MTPTVLIAVLIAALLHASWNAIVKVSGDRLVVIAVTMAATAILVMPALFILPLPAVESWKYLALSALIHCVYMLLLIRAYSLGEFVQIYPLVRGSAPLMTALLGFFLLNENLHTSEIAGLLFVVFGIYGIAVERSSGRKKLSGKALTVSLLTGLCIAIYSIVDGQGARVSTEPHAFIAWMLFVNGFILPLIAWRRRQDVFVSTVKSVWKQGLIVAVFSGAAYWIVVWAFSQERIAPVATLRETSVLFGALISAIFLKESFTGRRLFVVSIIVVGIALLGGILSL